MNELSAASASKFEDLEFGVIRYSACIDIVGFNRQLLEPGSTHLKRDEGRNRRHLLQDIIMAIPLAELKLTIIGQSLELKDPKCRRRRTIRGLPPPSAFQAA